MVRKLVPTIARYRTVIAALVLSNAVSVGFLVVRFINTDTWTYAFLLWNLVLAWLPLVFAAWLVLLLPRYRWLSWRNVLLTFLWLVFLPNSFYLASDLIHLRVSTQATVLFDAVMQLSFIFNGFVGGMVSVFLVHRELYRRFWAEQAHAVIGVVLLASSFAVYLGRNLRWNTWDVLLNPAGLLFDVSDRLINPTDHPQAFATTVGFFVLIGSVYIVIWQFAQALRRD